MYLHFFLVVSLLCPLPSQIATLRGILEAEKQSEMAALEQTLRAEHSASLNTVEQMPEDYKDKLAAECAERERELAAVHEETMAAMNSEWEAKLSRELEQCKSDLASRHAKDMEDARSQHSEELQNAVRACEKAHEEQITALKDEHVVALATRDDALRESVVPSGQEAALGVERLRAELEEQYTGMLADVHTQLALRTAVKLEESARQAAEEQERVVADTTSRFESQREREIATLEQEHHSTLLRQSTELQSRYETSLSQLDAAMATEREKQATLLRERHSQALKEHEAVLRAELAAAHGSEVEELLARCQMEKERDLEGLRGELVAENKRRMEEMREGLEREHSEKLR